jgi:glyoxylase-like metal-dependent hydrolase (beta-lactamase superfamily II)
MKHKNVVVGALETNCYLVYCETTRECAVVDPGADHEKIFLAIAEDELKPVVLVNTHGHVDHIGANRDVKEHFETPIAIHAADGPMLGKVQQLELSLFLGAKDSPAADRLLKDGDTIKFGPASALRVLHTPGHSPGSISLLGDGFVLSGDTLFNEGVGRTDLPGGSRPQLVKSIREKLMTLPDETLVFPGHGPHTTIGHERENNPEFE